MTIKNLQILGVKQLENLVFNPIYETDVLLSFVLNKERSFLYAHPELKLDKNSLSKYKKFITRRKKGEPFAYIVLEKEFYGQKFIVTPDVLIPRYDTELLINEAKNLIKKNKFKLCLDVGTGSGAIIISIASNTNKKIQFIGSDISSNALKIARKNAKILLPKNCKITFLKSDLLTNIKNISHPALIVANLPYLEKKETTKRKELSFEPKIALLGGKSGLFYIEKLIEQFFANYKKNDQLLLEIGYNQAEAIQKIVNKLNPKLKTKVTKDEAGFNRVVRIF